MKTRDPLERYRKLRKAHRATWQITFVYLLNVALYCLGHWILGGSALLAEGYEGESWLRPWNGDEFRVSEAVGWYSLLHGSLVFYSLPVIPICVLVLVYEWVKLQRLRRHLIALC